MATTSFAKHQSMLLRRGEKERVLFLAAAGLAFSLLLIMLVILNYKREAAASQNLALQIQPLQNSPVVPMSTVTLYVPDREVAAGSNLSDVTFKEVYWPRNQVPPNAIIDLSEVQGKYAKSNLAAGIPVQRAALTVTPGRAGLAVTPGNRAVTIEVDSSSSIEGYATPGSSVDVVLTYTEEGNLTSKVIVEGARVLSFGGDTTPGEKRRAATTTGVIARSTITLDVATQDALKIQTARQLGRLSLMLRNDIDTKGLGNATSFAAQEFAGKEAKVRKDGPACTRGSMKIGAVSYIVNCDGSMVEVKAE